MKWFIYGEVMFANTGTRNGARNRLNNLVVSRTDVVAEVWDNLTALDPAWSAGVANITGTSDSGASVPGFRFCYSATTQETADAFFNDVGSAWSVFGGSNSWWGYSLVSA